MNQTRTIRLPIHVVKDLNVCLRALANWHRHRAPTAEEIAEYLEKPVDEVRKMLRLNERISSVDTPIGGGQDKDKALLDIIADENDKVLNNNCKILTSRRILLTGWRTQSETTRY